MTGSKEAGHSCYVNLPCSQKKYNMHNDVCVNSNTAAKNTEIKNDFLLSPKDLPGLS